MQTPTLDLLRDSEFGSNWSELDGMEKLTLTAIKELDAKIDDSEERMSALIPTPLFSVTRSGTMLHLWVGSFGIHIGRNHSPYQRRVTFHFPWTTEETA